MGGRRKAVANRTFSRKLDAVSWSLLFMWIGIALIGDIGWGWSLLSVVAIGLAVQTALYVKRERSPSVA